MQEDVILAGKRLWKALVISKIKNDGGNITENTEPAIHTSQYIYLCMYLFIYPLLILSCYYTEIIYISLLCWRYSSFIPVPLCSTGLCKKHTVAGAERLGFILLRTNSCTCLLTHVFFLARNGSEKQEACQKRNHPLRKEPVIC